MTDESRAPQERDASGAPGSSRRTPSIFVTDAAAESARIADMLRMAGYAVFDVPLSMLASRAQAQRPNVVLLDVDAPDALAEIARLRRLPGAGSIDFVYVGAGDGPIRSAEDAIGNDGCAFFLRPIDVGALARRLAALTGGPIARAGGGSSQPPSIPGARASVPAERPSSASLPAPGLRTPGPPLPMSVPSLADLVERPRSLATFGTVSNELAELLADAEERAEVLPHVDAPLPSPEEEIEAVLPADVLASLDEPIEEDDDPEQRSGTGAGIDRDGTGHGKHTTSGGSRQTTTASGRSTVPQTHERRLASEAPRRGSAEPMREATPIEVRRGSAEAVPHAESAAPRPAEVVTGLGRPEAIRMLPSEVEASSPTSAIIDATQRVTVPTSLPEPTSSPRSTRGPNEDPARAPAAGIVVIEPSDARRFFADAIARRLSGALCFEDDGIVRRVVVRDGDLVTAASGADRESLVWFLGARGELPREEVERLAGKVPPYGRHAGAALVAHGWLGQDQLWSVLRAHAEWIATIVLRLGRGTAQLEPEPPGRLRSEPSAFAAKAGAEIFVELVRRAVPPDEAIDALGGEASRIGDGPAHALLSECALPPGEAELVARARGGTLGDLLARSPDAEIASMVYGLALLGVIEVIPGVEPARAVGARGDGSSPDLDSAVIDEEAVRARVRARLELVEEGDYFSILGVSRDATSYEVRRAFIELRRAFEPTRILTPRIGDLADEVRKIVLVLEEAYEILRDAARRERYRRAIDARPG